jgi:hypothetical protein
MIESIIFLVLYIPFRIYVYHEDAYTAVLMGGITLLVLALMKFLLIGGDDGKG